MHDLEYSNQYPNICESIAIVKVPKNKYGVRYKFIAFFYFYFFILFNLIIYLAKRPVYLCSYAAMMQRETFHMRTTDSKCYALDRLLYPSKIIVAFLVP